MTMVAEDPEASVSAAPWTTSSRVLLAVAVTSSESARMLPAAISVDVGPAVVPFIVIAAPPSSDTAAVEIR